MNKTAIFKGGFNRIEFDLTSADQRAKLNGLIEVFISNHFWFEVEYK